MNKLNEKVEVKFWQLLVVACIGYLSILLGFYLNDGVVFTVENPQQWIKDGCNSLEEAKEFPHDTEHRNVYKLLEEYRIDKKSKHIPNRIDYLEQYILKDKCIARGGEYQKSTSIFYNYGWGEQELIIGELCFVDEEAYEQEGLYWSFEADNKL